MLNREPAAGFLGEIYTDIPCVDQPGEDHWWQVQGLHHGSTDHRRAYQLDARRCISYLTIEHDGSIPEDW